MSGDYKFDTLSLHAGHVPDERHGSRAVPIHQTTSYVFKDTEHAAALYNQELGGHLYTRISNPTIAVLEQRIAALEGAVAATATASGMAALATALLVLCSQGDHIVASSRMYGANINLLENTLPRFGITTSFIDPNDLAGIENAIQPNTKVIFGEVIGLWYTNLKISSKELLNFVTLISLSVCDVYSIHWLVYKPPVIQPLAVLGL